MKTISFILKAVILMCCVIILSPESGQGGKNTRLQRQGAVGFSIGARGYIGTGFGYVYTTPYRKDFWEYNPSTDSWTQKADFGGTERYLAAGFSIGNKGYIGMGTNDSGTFKDFWEYDPVANTWTRKADFTGGQRTTPVSFSIGTKGYVGTGRGSVLTGDGCYDTKEFWEFDPNSGSAGTWTRKADFPGIERQGAAGFSIGSKGYIGTGIHYVSSTNYSFLSDFWEYDPEINAWIQKANTAGSGRTYAIGFNIGTRGYICTGNGTGGLFKDLQEYNPLTGSWNQKATFTQIGRDFTVGFGIGAKGYIGTGYIATATYVQDFWEFNQAVNTWARKTDFGSTRKGPLKEEVVIGEPVPGSQPELTVYPNPSGAAFSFRLNTMSNERVNIRIVDLTGRQVKDYRSLSPDHINVIGDDLAAGMFVAVVTQGTYRECVKLTRVK